MNILEHRKEIDRLDAQIVRLLNERTQHVLEIGSLKLKNGEAIYAPHRERAVFQRICRLNQGPITEAALRAIYREIMSAALSAEKAMAIAYLGPEATFTHQAAICKFGSSLQYSPLKTIAEVFAEVARGRADYGVVPVENSTEGVVTHTLDMFAESDLSIVAQIVMPIQYVLGSVGRRERIERLFVHPQALAQCRAWVEKRLPTAEIIETSSNARSAQLAASDPRAGALTGALAAERYGLRVLEQDVQDSANNVTRFLVLGRQCSPASGHDRTSIMFSIVHEVGALHRALAPFRRYRLNMTKIESRPSKRKPWEYFFFVDCDGHIHDRRVARAVELLKQHCNFVKILGSYPNAE